MRDRWSSPLAACSSGERGQTPGVHRTPTTACSCCIAQSVPVATQLPCVSELPAGWTFGGVRHLSEGSARFWLDSDRGGIHAVEVTLRPSCDIDGRRSRSVRPPTRRARGSSSRPDSPDPSFTGSRFLRVRGRLRRPTVPLRERRPPTLALEADEALSFLPARPIVARRWRTRYGLTSCAAPARRRARDSTADADRTIAARSGTRSRLLGACVLRRCSRWAATRRAAAPLTTIPFVGRFDAQMYTVDGRHPRHAAHLAVPVPERRGRRRRDDPAPGDRSVYLLARRWWRTAAGVHPHLGGVRARCSRSSRRTSTADARPEPSSTSSASRSRRGTRRPAPATAVALVLAFFPAGPTRRKWEWVAVGFAFVMAFSRVYLHAHWFSRRRRRRAARGGIATRRGRAGERDPRRGAAQAPGGRSARRTEPADVA